MAFDADSFLSQEIDANFDTEFTPIPEGEFEAQIDSIQLSSFTDRDSGEEKPILKPMWRILDPEVIEATGMENPKCPQTVFLDYEGGVLLTGTNKNIMLGKLKEMAGNPANFTLNDLVGVTATVRVKQRILDDGRPFAEVKNVTEA